MKVSYSFFLSWQRRLVWCVPRLLSISDHHKKNFLFVIDFRLYLIHTTARVNYSTFMNQTKRKSKLFVKRNQLRVTYKGSLHRDVNEYQQRTSHQSRKKEIKVLQSVLIVQNHGEAVIGTPGSILRNGVSSADL